MTSGDYDLDLSGGLMEEIERLVAPPQSEELTKRKRREHAYYRKPGKPHNHDVCDSCAEGGDLLCCDKCPASFHMECHDPPLEDDEIPYGEWVCHRCKSRPKPIDDEVASNCSSKSRHSENSASRKSSRRPSPIPTAITDYDIVQEVRRETLEPRHPLQILAKAASLMNPKQFEIPKELNCPYQLQGSSKRKWWIKDPVPNKSGKKLPHEIDNGMVSLPAKVCFMCSRSCRKAPLLQCDYCPLLFHLDCLDPPLSTMPRDRWMCPNHCEHSLDEKLLKSTKLTQRIKIWNQFTGPVNQHQTKVHFLNKLHRKNPPFRIKVKHKRKLPIKVPESIRCQYTFPPPLLPGMNQVSMPIDRPPETTDDEQNTWLSSVVSLQSGIIRHLSRSTAGPHSGDQETPSSMATSMQTTSSVSVATSSSSTVLSSSGVSMANKPTASVTPTVVKNSNDLSAVTHNLTGNETKSTTGESSKNISTKPVSGVLFNGGGPNRRSSRDDVIDDSVSMETSDDDEVVTMEVDKIPTATKTKIVEINCKNNNKDIVNGFPSSSISASDVSDIEDSDKSVKSGNVTSTSSLKSADKSLRVTSSTDTAIISSTSSQPDSHSGTGNQISMETDDNVISSSSNSSTQKLLGDSNHRTIQSNESNKNSTVGEMPSSLLRTTDVVGKDGESSSNGECNSTSTSSGKEVISLGNNLCTTLTGLGSSKMAELQVLVDSKEEVDVSQLDPQLLQYLAIQRLKQLTSPPGGEAKEDDLWGSRKDTTLKCDDKGQVKQSLVLDAKTKGCDDVRARALLCPLTGRGEAKPMTYRNLTIGTGGDMDVCLTSYGDCSYVSPKHACIFYDQATRHFELINYSDHGTTVDNVLYSCDFSEKVSHSPNASRLVNNVRKIVKKAKTKKVKEECDVKPQLEDMNREYMSGDSHQTSTSCMCRTSSSSLIGGSGAGWEGTALLHHGSYIKLGCLQFVFSIVENARRQPIIIQRAPPPLVTHNTPTEAAL